MRSSRSLRAAIWLGAVVAGLPLAAAADRLSFNYVQADYVEAERRDAGDDFDGGGLVVSMDITPTMYGYFRGRATTLDSDTGDADLNGYSAGIGFHRTAGGNDVFTPFALFTVERLELEPDAGSDEQETGWGAEFGFRRAYGRWFQLDASVKYYDVNDLGNNDFGAQVEGQIDLNERFALAVAYEDIQDYEQLSAGIRMYFHSPLSGAN